MAFTQLRGVKCIECMYVYFCSRLVGPLVCRNVELCHVVAISFAPPQIVPTAAALPRPFLERLPSSGGPHPCSHYPPARPPSPPISLFPFTQPTLGDQQSHAKVIHEYP